MNVTEAFWSGLVPFATVLSGVAAAIALLIGAISLRLLARQTKEASESAQRSNAFEAHKEYLKFCIDHPELSSSYMMLKFIGRRSFKGILGQGTVETEKALWFLSYVLFAMEQLAWSWCKDGAIDPAWEHTIVAQLGYHKALLIEVWPEWAAHYGPDLDRLVKLALDRDDPIPALAAPTE